MVIVIHFDNRQRYLLKFVELLLRESSGEIHDLIESQN